MKGFKLYQKAIAIFLITCIFNLLIACSSEKATEPITASDASIQESAFDFELCVPCEFPANCSVTNAEFYTYNDGIGDELYTVFNMEEVQYIINKFENEGYAYDPLNSYVALGSGVLENTNDSVVTKIINLTLRYLVDTTHSFVQISFISSPNHPELTTFINTAIVSFVHPENQLGDYEQFHIGSNDEGGEVYLWIKEYVSPFGPKYDSNRIAWSWNKWFKCSAKVFISGCVGSMVGCTLAGPGYAACLNAGCTGSAVVGMVSCALDQWN